MAQRRCDSTWFKVWGQEEVLGILDQGCLRLRSKGTGHQEPLISNCSMPFPVHCWFWVFQLPVQPTWLTSLAHGSLEPSAGGHVLFAEENNEGEERLQALLQIPTLQIGCLVSGLGFWKPLVGRKHIPKGGLQPVGLCGFGLKLTIPLLSGARLIGVRLPLGFFLLNVHGMLCEIHLSLCFKLITVIVETGLNLSCTHHASPLLEPGCRHIGSERKGCVE